MPYTVVVANAGQEREARREVRDLGFATYQPVFKEQKIIHGRKRWVEQLLLGRYFFAKHEPARKINDILNLRRVFGVLMHGDGSLRPAFATDAEIERIRLCEDAQGFVTMGARDQFSPGQLVRAVMGAFVGLEGAFVGTGRGGTDVALFDVFGRRTKIEFKAGALAPA